MQQQNGFIVDDNESLIDWQKVFTEDIFFSDSENDFSPETVAFLGQKAISKDGEMGISPLNRDKTFTKGGICYCSDIQPEQSCMNVSHKMQNSIEKEAVSATDIITSNCNRQKSKTYSSENYYKSHLNCKSPKMFSENKIFPLLGNKHLKTSNECFQVSFIENEPIINREKVRQGSIYFHNLDIFKIQCELASEMNISSQDSSNTQIMVSQSSSTEEMAVSSQESIERYSSEKMNMSQEKEDMIVSSQESMERYLNEKMNISQEKEDMAVSSQETLVDSPISEKMNISQGKENPKMLSQENCDKPEDIIKFGQCSFLPNNLSKTVSKYTSRILHLENFNKVEFLKNATLPPFRKSQRQYSKALKNNQCLSIIKRELRVAKRETALHIRQKLLAMKEANLLRREKILEDREKKYRIYEESI